jgi:hypothetical protein
MPRSALGPKRWPVAATYTTLLLRGSSTTRAMVCVSRSPICVKVFPPSVVLYIPSPKDEVCRLLGSPVPT